MGLATVIRLEFAYPGVGILAGDSIQYLSIATAHGVIMVFYMIMPTVFGAFGNFLLPTQLGVHDVAFPRLNSAAFWFLPGGLIMLCQLVCVDRRYQRMNCFNIRELQGSLKRKFFDDLVNSQSSHELLNESVVGLRFKKNENSFIDPTFMNLLTIAPSFENNFRNNNLLPSYNLLTPYVFNAKVLNNATTTNLCLSESSHTFRNQRFVNPLISYDYKTGHYLGIWEQLHPQLLNSFIEVARGIRKAPWFFSEQYPLGLKDTLSNYNSKFTTHFTLKLADSEHWNSVHVSPTNNFLNIISLFHKNEGFINSKWFSLNTSDQKFYRMFESASTQQRVLSNWRSLKFSREAWRCKLLVARNQNSLYRRFTGEEGLVWAIERNTKDLLPGWAMVTPFSARTRYTAIGKTDMGLMGVFLAINASIVSSANFLVTYRYLSTLNNRKMRDARSFFTEGLITASWMMIAANPMLAIGILMLLCDRHWQTSFFDYSGGGDTVLFQHMFWFFGHPEVYIIMLPVFGFTNTIMSFYLRKRVSARASLLYSMYTIAFLGFFVWGHHMYMVGLSHTTRMLFSTLTVMISVPAATKLMHWCVTIVNSNFTMELPLLFTLTFVFFFVSGGVSGMYVAHTGMDVLFHDTFYVIGHFHVMFAGAAMLGIFSAFYFYFPVLFGVKYSRVYAYIHYVYYLFGQLLTVIPMLWLGYCGQPRRVLDYPSALGGWHGIASAGHLLSVAAILAFFFMIYDSIRQAKPAIRNTFGAGRFNTRLNFYYFEAYRISFIQRKSFHMHRSSIPAKGSLRKNTYLHLSSLESTLFNYSFTHNEL